MNSFLSKKLILAIVTLLVIATGLLLALLYFFFIKSEDTDESSPESAPIQTAQCTYEGKTYNPGDTFPAKDGCNTCGCGDGGGIICGIKQCIEEDTDSEIPKMSEHYLKDLDLYVSTPPSWELEDHSTSIPSYSLKDPNSRIVVNFTTDLAIGWCEGVGDNNPYKCVTEHKSFEVMGEEIFCYASIITLESNNKPQSTDSVEVVICPPPDFYDEVADTELSTGSKSKWENYKIFVSGMKLKDFRSDTFQQILESIR